MKGLIVNADDLSLTPAVKLALRDHNVAPVNFSALVG